MGKERIDEAYDPEIAINRALNTYRKKEYSEEWINQRILDSIERILYHDLILKKSKQ